MPSENNITDLIKYLTDPKVSAKPVIAQVIEVNGNLCDCEPVDDSGRLFDVRLQTSSESGVLIVPALGSKVLVLMVNNTLGFVVSFGEVSEVIIKNGDNGGVVKVSDLVNKLNNIENDLNTLKSITTAWVPIPSDGGLALKTALTTWSGDLFIPTISTELENQNFKH